MFALVLVGALVGQSLAAPSNCGTSSICDHRSGQQIAGSGAGGYSSYSKWGSHSSWESGSRSGSSGDSARLETLGHDDDQQNVIGSAGLDRPGNWHDEKHYVTDDRKGKIDYEAHQEVGTNSYRKEAKTSYRYGSHDNHELHPQGQLIPSAQFDSQIQDVERDMRELMGRFSFGAGSLVTQQTLDSFRQQSQRLQNEVSLLCSQATGVDSQALQQLQQIQANFDAQVAQKQQELMSYAFQRKVEHKIESKIEQSYGGSAQGQQQYAQPIQQYVQPVQPYVYPTRPVYPVPAPAPATPSPQEVQSQRVQQECNQLRASIDEFYQNFVAKFSNFDREDTLAAYRNQVDTQVAALTQRIANLRVESANLEYHKGLVESLNTTFQRYVQDLSQRIADCEKQIRAEQLRAIEEQEHARKEQLRIEMEESEKRYQESLRFAEQQRLDAQRVIEAQERATAEQTRLKKLEAEQEWQRKEAERLRHQEEVIISQQQQYTQKPQPAQQQQLPAVQTVAPSASSSGGYSHQINVEYSGSGRVSSSGSSHSQLAGGSQVQQQYQPITHYQPAQIGPHVDFTDVMNKMNQEYNKLVTSVSGLGSYSMSLTQDNQQRLEAQFQQDYARLRQNIDSLCQQSSQYHNANMLQSAENLKRELQQSLDYFQQEVAKMSASASGGYQDNSSYQTSGGYANVHQPRVSNVEYSHSKSTELELSGRHAGQQTQNIVCVEQEVGQPCYQPPRQRREAGGYYSQQRESNYDEYAPRNQRRRNYTPEDYSQQHTDPQLELDEYSQRQPIRSERFGRRGHDSQRHEDLTRQTDRYSRRNQYGRNSRYGEQESEDSSQQYVQRGQNEDFANYQKPRRERVQAAPKFERLEDFDEPNVQGDERQQRTRQVQSANSQREQSSASTGRTLLDQRLVVDEPGELVKPIEKPGSARGVNGYTLDNSGFYDNSKQQEHENQSYERPNQAQEEEEQKPHILSDADLTLDSSGFDDDQQQQHQQQAVTESSPVQVTTFKSLDDSQRSEDLTLNNSGFFENAGRGRESERSRVPDDSQSSQRNEDLVQQRGNVESRDEQVAQTAEGDSIQRSTGQANFGPDVQSGRRDSSLSHERIDHAQNPTQSREHEPRNEHPRGQYIDNLAQQNSAPAPNVIDLDEPNVQFGVPDGQSNENVAQPENRQPVAPYTPARPVPQHPIPRYNQPGQDGENVQQQTENEHVEQSVNQNADDGFNAPTRPVPQHPIPRYNQPGQGSQNVHVPQQTRNEYVEQSENRNVDDRFNTPARPVPQQPISRYNQPGQSSQNFNAPQQTRNEYVEHSGNQNADDGFNRSGYSNEFDKPAGPHRGDLPGHSEPVTEEPEYVPPETTPEYIQPPTTPAYIPPPTTTPAPFRRPIPQAPIPRPIPQAPITERPSQKIVEPVIPSQRPPCYNRCSYNPFDQLSQSYYYHQQNQHNITFSRSIYNNQRVGTNSAYKNPFYINGQTRISQQVSPVNHIPEGGFTINYKDHQTNSLRINHQGLASPFATQSTAYEQNDLLGLNGQEHSQQVQKPVFDNASGQRGFNQYHSSFTVNHQASQSLDDGFPARVVPLSGTQSRNMWADVESTKRPSYWKRSGQKSSNEYESVGQSARTVYG